MLKHLTTRVTDDTIEKISNYAKKTGRTHSEVARMAIERGVREMIMFNDMGLSDLEGMAKDLPLVFKKFLLDIAFISIQLEDLVEHQMPHQRADNGDLMKRAINKIEAVYFSEPKAKSSKRKWL